MDDVRTAAQQALDELAQCFDGMQADAPLVLAQEMLEAKTIVCFGMGREGLMVRAFCMRLMHLGLDAHMAGDVTTPPIGPGDALFLSTGPGDLLLARSMMELARDAGARVIAITAQPDGPDLRLVDRVIHLPAQTMADDQGSESVLPMGTAFEIAMLVFLDLVAIELRRRTGQSMDDLRARHYNLE